MTTLIFVLLAGLAVGSAIAVVVQRNPLYSAISLVGVFIALAGLYLTLAAPFLAAIQIIVYAGAIMVLVVFVIMLLNVEEEEHKPLKRLRYLIPTAVVLAAILFAEAGFILFFVNNSPVEPLDPNSAINPSNVGLTATVGTGLFTSYLLPFEITSVLLLMAIVGAMTLARRVGLRPTDLAVPGSQVLPRHTIEPRAVGDATEVVATTTADAERVLGLEGLPHRRGDE
ncbi:MAG TPA: NADH-quinone oxidoreductase subunit J [Pyrinomonadaceae bacterium]|nr:NADH-quinone oxidoreductase subunit J [Pyrinomonadaceae bacterium]